MAAAKKQAMRFNSAKLDLSYLLEFPKAFAAWCNVCKFGEFKYNRGNFKIGGKPDLEYYQSALRHMQDAFTAMNEGDEDGQFDADSGLHHIAHAAWNMLALLELNAEKHMRFDSQAEFLEHCRETAERYAKEKAKAQGGK